MYNTTFRHDRHTLQFFVRPPAEAFDSECNTHQAGGTVTCAAPSGRTWINPSCSPPSGSVAGEQAPDLVVAGRTSFHEPSCHLIEGRSAR